MTLFSSRSRRLKEDKQSQEVVEEKNRDEQSLLSQRSTGRSLNWLACRSATQACEHILFGHRHRSAVVEAGFICQVLAGENAKIGSIFMIEA